MTQAKKPPRAQLELELGERVQVSTLTGEGARLVREIAEQTLADGVDHRYLSGREAENQHPVAAIAGLEDELKRIPAPTEALTNQELEELLK